VLLVLAFPPFGLWPLTPVSVAALMLVCRDISLRASATLGLVFGLAFFLGLMPWLRVIGVDAWVALSVLEALYIAALAIALRLVAPLPGWPVWSAALWVVEEAARSRTPFGGFPWGRLAYSQTFTPFTPYAALGGAPLLSFSVALSGGLLAWAVVHRRSPIGSLGGVLAAVAVVAPPFLVPIPTSGTPVVAAVIQGDVPRTGLDAFGQASAVLSNHVNATYRLAQQVKAGDVAHPQLVIWPENASDIDPFASPQAHAAIDDAVNAIGAPTLVGIVTPTADRSALQNMGVVWTPGEGPGEEYVKRHLVPFGEYVPFRRWLEPLVSRLRRVPEDFRPGTKPGLLTIGPAQVGDVICFEVAYDGVVRDVVDAGAQLIAIQTNNATYGRTGQVTQQLAISRLRAVEHGRAVLVAATSGISAIIAPDGSIIAEAPEFTQAELVGQVPLRTAKTVADRLGATPESLLVIVGLAGLFLGLRRRHGEEET
jgi:apolipoprotein N-acyltransferase